MTKHIRKDRGRHITDASAWPRSGGICGPAIVLMTRLAAAMELAAAAEPSLELTGYCDPRCPQGVCRLHWCGDRTTVAVTAAEGMELRLSLDPATLN